MPYILKGRVDKPCEECGARMEQVSSTRIYCDKCSSDKHNKRRRSIRNEPLHQCATCDDFIPISKTHCGRINYKNGCAYKHAALTRDSQYSKPKADKSEKSGKERMKRNHVSDQACSSGFF